LDPNSRERRMNRTALMAAAMNGKTGICKILIDSSADANAVDSENRTALIYAKQRGNKETADYLQSVNGVGKN